MGLFASNKDIDESMLLVLADKLSDKILRNWGVQITTEPPVTPPTEPPVTPPTEPPVTPPTEPPVTPPTEPPVTPKTEPPVTQSHDIMKKIEELTKIVTKQSPIYSNLGGTPETFEDILHQQPYYPKKEVSK